MIYKQLTYLVWAQKHWKTFQNLKICFSCVMFSIRPSFYPTLGSLSFPRFLDTEFSLSELQSPSAKRRDHFTWWRRDWDRHRVGDVHVPEINLHQLAAYRALQSWKTAQIHLPQHEASEIFSQIMSNIHTQYMFSRIKWAESHRVSSHGSLHRGKCLNVPETLSLFATKALHLCVVPQIGSRNRQNRGLQSIPLFFPLCILHPPERKSVPTSQHLFNENQHKKHSQGSTAIDETVLSRPSNQVNLTCMYVDPETPSFKF